MGGLYQGSQLTQSTADYHRRYGGSVQPGLRERKKQQTRATLVPVALDLVDRQGYERTTVEQIADAAEVSPRTVARYFPTKDLLLLSLLDTFTDAVNDELAPIPLATPPLQALLAANLTMLEKAAPSKAAMTPPRIDTTADDSTVALIGAMWAAVTSTAWHSLRMDETLDRIEVEVEVEVEDLPQFMSRKLFEAFHDLAALTADLPTVA